MLVKMVNGRMYEKRNVCVLSEDSFTGKTFYHGFKEEWVEIVPCWEKPKHLGPKVRKITQEVG